MKKVVRGFSAEFTPFIVSWMKISAREQQLSESNNAFAVLLREKLVLGTENESEMPQGEKF